MCGSSFRFWDRVREVSLRKLDMSDSIPSSVCSSGHNVPEAAYQQTACYTLANNDGNSSFFIRSQSVFNIRQYCTNYMDCLTCSASPCPALSFSRPAFEYMKWDETYHWAPASMLFFHFTSEAGERQALKYEFYERSKKGKKRKTSIRAIPYHSAALVVELPPPAKDGT